MNTFKRAGFALLLLISLSAYSFAGTYSAIEQGRSHTAAGAFGCTVSGATNATPIVITCAAAHNLIDGDAIQITGVGGNTNANTVGYAKITGYSTTTFGLYSDSALSTGVAGNASYTSGGAVSMAYDVSGITGDYTLKFRLVSMTASKNALISIQESADGFASDIRTLEVIHVNGSVPVGGIAKSWRKYTTSDARVGTANTRLRIYVQAIDSAATAVIDFGVEQ